MDLIITSSINNWRHQKPNQVWISEVPFINYFLRPIYPLDNSERRLTLPKFYFLYLINIVPHSRFATHNYTYIISWLFSRLERFSAYSLLHDLKLHQYIKPLWPIVVLVSILSRCRVALFLCKLSKDVIYS